MSAPVIWIIFPGVMAGLLYIIRRWQRLTIWLGIGIALILCGLAALVKIGIPVHIWRWSFPFSDTLTLFGRRFVLDNSSRPALFTIYLVTAFWLGGSLAARAGLLVPPLALGIVASLTAALAVNPFLYAGLLIEMAVLASIPLLTSPGHPVGRGVLRFLVFQTLGMMLLLFTGWIMAEVDVNPGDQALAARAAIFLGLGFALLLAVIPFQTWIPMLAEEAHPYTAGLIFLMLPEMVMLFGLSFLDRYAWLRGLPATYESLRLAGVVSIFIGGWWAASQSNIGRMFGYAAIMEIGYSLLAVGTTDGIPLHFALLMPRALGFGVFSLALSTIRARTGGLDLRQVQGVIRNMPLASASVVVSLFTLAGFPLLAGFPVHLALWETVGKQFHWAALWSIMGSAGLMTAGLRSLAVFLTTSNEKSLTRESSWKVTESRLEIILLGAGIAALLVAGLFSQFYFPALTGVAQGLEHLVP
jgi:NADH-quinone oxidoreductase subunit N